MTTELTPQQKFEESIKNRLRQDIGELLPGDVLSDLVKKAIQDLFFTRKEHRSQYGTLLNVENSWFETAVIEATNRRISGAITAYFDAHAEEIMQAAAKTIADNAPKLLAQFLVGMFQSAQSTQAFSLQAALQQEITNRITR